MARNTHTLLLLNQNEQLNQQLAVLFYKLSRAMRQEARQISQRMGVSVAKIWDEEWFRHRYAARPGWIKLEFETDSNRHFPVNFLQQMFNAGVTGAVLETFHDRVCEASRCYFFNGCLIREREFMHWINNAADTCRQIFSPNSAVYIENPAVPVSLDCLCETGEEIHADADISDASSILGHFIRHHQDEAQAAAV